MQPSDQNGVRRGTELDATKITASSPLNGSEVDAAGQAEGDECKIRYEQACRQDVLGDGEQPLLP